MNGLKSTIGIHGFHELKLRPFLNTPIVTLRSEDGDGGENVAEKVNSRF